MSTEKWKLLIDQVDEIAKTTKTSRAEIARKAEMDPGNLQRFFNQKNKTTLPILIKVLDALDFEIKLQKKEK